MGLFDFFRNKKILSKIKKEHNELLNLFLEIENLAKENRVEEFKRKVYKFNGILEEHLEYEDKFLYPALVKSKAYEIDFIISKSEEMKRVSNFLLNFGKELIFCDRIDDNILNSLAKFKDILLKRIKFEEDKLLTKLK